MNREVTKQTEERVEYPSTILIVDDEPIGRETLAGALTGQGYRLAFASNGQETLAKATELTPDLILLDVMMPDMDGFEVCRHLRAAPFLSEVPVIMVTALDDRASRLQGIEAGADDFISKPFDHVELRARVRTITRLNRYRRLLSERVKFEWVATQAIDGYLILNDEGHVLYANPKARLYLGLSTDQNAPVTETFQQLVRKQYHLEPQSAWSTWSSERSGAQAPRYLVRPETSTTTAFWLQVDILRPPGGPDVHWIVQLRDVTKQLALQRDMRGFHKLVFHKLRTPLIGMLSSQELLVRHTPKLSTEEIVEISERSLKSMHRLQNQIEDILKYLQAPDEMQVGSRFELSQLQSVTTQIGANLEIEPVVVFGHEEAGERQTLLTRRAVELILWEIMENAKKFHPEQEPILEIFVSQAKADEVTIQIRDNGLTLSPEQLANMWIPYYQGEKHFTGETVGMGLGLPMVASLLWNVGGTCSAYNRDDGPGITIELVLPLVKKQDDNS